MKQVEEKGQELPHIILKNVNMPSIVKWLNDKFKKKSGKPFTKSDVQQYCRLKHIPFYLGTYNIERVADIEVVRLYNVVQYVEDVSKE